MSLLCAGAHAQMRPITELLDIENAAWTNVKPYINQAKNIVEILPADLEKSKEVLHKIQVTTRSPMGSIVYFSGGLLVENGWIRILGSGSTKLNRDIASWNKDKGFKKEGAPPGHLYVADDAIGGFFALNGGDLGKDLGKIYYLAPDSLEFEPLDMTYSGFLEFCLNGDLSKFYKSNRWSSYKEDLKSLAADNVFIFYPYLWTKEGKNIEKNSRKIAPVEEQYQFSMTFRKQLSLK